MTVFTEMLEAIEKNKIKEATKLIKELEGYIVGKKRQNDEYLEFQKNSGVKNCIVEQMAQFYDRILTFKAK